MCSPEPSLGSHQVAGSPAWFDLEDSIPSSRQDLQREQGKTGGPLWDTAASEKKETLVGHMASQDGPH